MIAFTFKNKFDANNIHLNDGEFINNNFENTHKSFRNDRDGIRQK